MPTKPKKPCSFPGCPNLCDGQYCEVHRAPAKKQYDKYRRSPDINKKYGRAWKRIRDRYIASHPLCEKCLTDSTDNLMSLCQSCHNKIHREIGDR